MTEGYSILQPRVGISMPSAGRSRFARLFAGDAGHRPVHARRLRRLPGPVPRGVVHRQGDLRRRRPPAGDRRAVPREPRPQPRSARRRVRAVGAGQRRDAVRGLSRRPTRPTSAGGIGGSAATGRSRRGCCPRVPGAPTASGARAEPAVGAVALEDLRQPPPQPRAGRAAGAAARRLARARRRAVLHAGRRRRSCCCRRC